MTQEHRALLVFLSFVAFLFFALCGAFGTGLGGVNELYAALSSLAAGLVLKYLPGGSGV